MGMLSSWHSRNERLLRTPSAGEGNTVTPEKKNNYNEGKKATIMRNHPVTKRTKMSKVSLISLVKFIRGQRGNWGLL